MVAVMRGVPFKNGTASNTPKKAPERRWERKNVSPIEGRLVKLLNVETPTEL
jgi:hypothetical protein